MSSNFTVVGVASCALVATLLCACAAETPADDGTSAPEVTLDGLDLHDEGTSYNGWTQNITNSCSTQFQVGSVQQTLNRTSGDSTRGGGVCLVKKRAAGCTADSQCQAAAVSEFGSEAYGYCYAGTCYSRPGSQAANCSVNPNRSSGDTQFKTFIGCYIDNYALGCMTKTAGPNTACGGTDTSLYMRSVKVPSFS